MLPIRVIPRLTVIDVRFPINRVMRSPVEDKVISPKNSLDDASHAMIPDTSPIMAPDVAACLFVFFHNKAKDIGATAEPIRIPIIK